MERLRLQIHVEEMSLLQKEWWFGQDAYKVFRACPT